MRFLFNLIRWIFGILLLSGLALIRLVFRPLRRKSSRWLMVRLEGSLFDLPRPGARYAGLFGRDRPLVLLEILSAMQEAARDPDITGIVCRLGGFHAPWSSLWELRQGLLRFRESGKKVLFYFDHVSNRDYWLATCADEVLLCPEGGVDLIGLRAEVTFLRRLLDRVGAVPEFLRAGKFKSFGETFTEDNLTPEMEESLGALVDDLSGVLVEGIAVGRALGDNEVQALIDRGPFSAQEALEARLVDGILYPDELKKHLEDKAEGGRRTRRLPFKRYARRLARKKWLGAPLRTRPRIAIVNMAGTIVERHARMQTPMPGGIDASTYVKLLNSLRKDPLVAGVVLRVDSPGGSALASDLIWRAVKRLQECKPLSVSMGSTTASGGYYIAAPAGRIFASPVTMTGSIGVIGGKFSVGELLERLGVRRVAIERGRHAGIYTGIRPFSESERERIQETVRAHYASFVGKVGEGRKLEPDAVESAAQGRIWSGQRAMRVGLVDALGGLTDVIREMREKLESPVDSRVFVISPRSVTPLIRLLTAGATGALDFSGGSVALLKHAGGLASLVARLELLAREDGHPMAVLPFQIDIR